MITMRKMNENIEKLIGNHRVTKLEADVYWLKKLSAAQVTILSGILLTLFGLLVKLIGG